MVLSAISSLPHRPLECPQCHWQDWIRTVLQETSKLGECLGCSRPSRWWWSDMGVVAGRRGGGCDEGPHSWCATDAHYAAFCSPFLDLHKCFRHLHLYFFHVQKYLSLFHNFIIISENVHLFFPSTRKSTYSRILWEVHFINCEHPSGWFNTLLIVKNIATQLFLMNNHLNSTPPCTYFLKTFDPSPRMLDPPRGGFGEKDGSRRISRLLLQPSLGSTTLCLPWQWWWVPRFNTIIIYITMYGLNLFLANNSEVKYFWVFQKFKMICGTYSWHLKEAYNFRCVFFLQPNVLLSLW